MAEINYPLLFYPNETAFETNGVGPLDPASCIVTEERNGQFELDMDIPVGSLHSTRLMIGRLVLVPPYPSAPRRDWEPFEIVEIEHTLSQMLHIRAWHVSYRLSRVCVLPFTAPAPQGSSPYYPINWINNFADIYPTNHGFTIRSYLTTETLPPEYVLSDVRTLRELLGGRENSFLDLYGGEYKWKRFEVLHYPTGERGKNSDVVLQYGVNITSLSRQQTADDVYSGIVPYWTGDDGNGGITTVTLSEKGIYYDGALRDWYSNYRFAPVDFSNKFETMPTQGQLRNLATQYLFDNLQLTIPENIDVSFVQEADKSNYLMQNLKLCDTLTVEYEDMGLSYTAMVTKTVFNVLLNRYDEISVSTEPVTLNKAIRQVVRK